MLGAQHSARMEKVFMGIAGLRVVTPSNARQAYGLLKSAVRCNDPVFINEHELMYNMKSDVPDEEFFLPLEGSEIARAGRDVTLFGYNISVHWCLQAAEMLAQQHGIEAEVVDLYALSPLDRAGIAASVSHTHRAVIVEEAEAAGRRRCRSHGHHQRRMLLRTGRTTGTRLRAQHPDSRTTTPWKRPPCRMPMTWWQRC